MDAWLLILIFAAVLTGCGFVQSCIGFGYAVVAMSILPYIMDVRLANLALSLSVILPTILAVRAYRHDLDWPALVWSLAGATLLLPIGLLAFAYLSADVLFRGTGLAILLVTLPELRNANVISSRPTSRMLSAAAGAISGFLTGAVGIGGPPIAAYAVRQRWSPSRFKAFVLAFLLLLSLAKALGVAAAGWVDETVLVYSAIAIPFAMLGGYLGIRASRRFEGHHFRHAIVILLLVNSTGMLIRGSPVSEIHNRDGNGAAFSAANIQNVEALIVFPWRKVNPVEAEKLHL
jgi:uncharacterized protein